MLNRLLAVVLLAFGLTMSQLSAQTLKVPFGTLSAGPNLPTDVLKIVPLGDVAVLVHESGRLTLIDKDGGTISTLLSVPKGTTYLNTSYAGLYTSNFQIRDGKVYFETICPQQSTGSTSYAVCAFNVWSQNGVVQQVIDLSSSSTVLVKSLHGVNYLTNPYEWGPIITSTPKGEVFYFKGKIVGTTNFFVSGLGLWDGKSFNLLIATGLPGQPQILNGVVAVSDDTIGYVQYDEQINKWQTGFYSLSQNKVVGTNDATARFGLTLSRDYSENVLFGLIPRGTSVDVYKLYPQQETLFLGRSIIPDVSKFPTSNGLWSVQTNSAVEFNDGGVDWLKALTVGDTLPNGKKTTGFKASAPFPDHLLILTYEGWVRFNYEAFLLPQITSVVNGASFGDKLSSGAIGTIFGKYLGQIATAGPQASFKLGGASVAVCGFPARLFYNSGEFTPNIGGVTPQWQVNFLVPKLPPTVKECETSAAVEKSVAERQVSKPLKVALSQVSPAIFLYSATRRGTQDPTILPIATNSSYQLVGPEDSNIPSVQVSENEIFTLWGTGFGQVFPEVLDASNSDGSAKCVDTPIVKIGGVNAEVLYCGFAAGVSGLLQPNIRVPLGTVAGPNYLWIGGAPPSPIYILWTK